MACGRRRSSTRPSLWCAVLREERGGVSLLDVMFGPESATRRLEEPDWARSRRPMPSSALSRPSGPARACGPAWWRDPARENWPRPGGGGLHPGRWTTLGRGTRCSDGRAEDAFGGGGARRGPSGTTTGPHGQPRDRTVPRRPVPAVAHYRRLGHRLRAGHPSGVRRRLLDPAGTCGARCRQACRHPPGPRCRTRPRDRRRVVTGADGTARLDAGGGTHAAGIRRVGGQGLRGRVARVLRSALRR